MSESVVSLTFICPWIFLERKDSDESRKDKASETTFLNEALSVSSAELSDDNFRKPGALDIALPLRRLGVLEPMSASAPEMPKFEQEMMYIVDSGGNEVDKPVILHTIDITTFRLDYVLVGGSTGGAVAPEAYYNVYRYELNWEYRGKTYPRINARINYEIYAAS